MNDTVSVCVPVYNGDRYLHECLSSIINQSYVKIEVLIIDDGSDDNSVAIANEFVSADSRVRLIINRKNQGLVGNWQRCIELATGKWIKFLFQDDLMHPSCVEQMLAACQQQQAQVCLCSREFLLEDSAGATMRQFFTEEVVKLEDTYPQPTYLAPGVIATLAARHLFSNFTGEPIALLFDKDVVRQYGSYNEDLVQLVDYEFALRVCLNVGAYFLPQKLVSFRVHSSSESSNQTSTPMKALKSQFLEPLLLYHEYAFNPHFKGLRKAYDVTAKKMLRDALHFYKYRAGEFTVPADMKKRLFGKYRGLRLIALGSRLLW